MEAMTPKQLLNLPATRITLVGRSAELDSLAGQALNVPGRLLTLTGPGGVGKTSLALAVARRISPEFAAGVCLADLSAVTGEETLRLAVANAVGVRESAERPLKEALLSFLRDVEMLLVVDNCEHVIDTCAALIDELLAGCARLRILATSREALRISGEVTYTVDPLPIPSAELSESPAALVENASVELFLERARAVRPGLKLTARNSGAITEICRRLEGIPLGLELAASQAAGLSLDAIAGRLGESFDLLMGRSRLRPRRQQTLRATLEWSHDLLSPPEQAVFRRLAAFAGGWTAEAARFVCEAEGIEGESVVDQLAGLVEKSLAVFEERDGAVPVPGTGAPVCSGTAGRERRVRRGPNPALRLLREPCRRG